MEPLQACPDFIEEYIKIDRQNETWFRKERSYYMLCFRISFENVSADLFKKKKN